MRDQGEIDIVVDLEDVVDTEGTDHDSCLGHGLHVGIHLPAVRCGARACVTLDKSFLLALDSIDSTQVALDHL